MICNECETVAHCSKHGCIPKQSAQRKPFAWANTDDLSADTAFRWCEIGNHKTPIYTSPTAQRKRDVMSAIEAKLKEKNT